MLKTVSLLLPALVPSWRFFDMIAPSPRIEFALLKTVQDTPKHWEEFRPRPQHVSISRMFKSLICNARWNETLFLVSCAERLMQHPTEHSRQEIFRRIKNELEQGPVGLAGRPYLQFRLVFLSRQEEEVQKQVTFISPLHNIFESIAA